jgi:hypothetical protein
MEDEHRRVLGRKVVHIAVAAAHRDFVVVVVHKGFAVDRAVVVIPAGRRVAGLEIGHTVQGAVVPGMALENTGMEDIVKRPFVQVVVVLADCILIGSDTEMMFRTSLYFEVVQRVTVELLVNQDVEVLEGRPVVEMLEDTGFEPARDMADRRYSLRLTSCSREAFVAVKVVWLRTRARLVPVQLQAARWNIDRQKQCGD